MFYESTGFGIMIGRLCKWLQFLDSWEVASSFPIVSWCWCIS